MPREGMVPFIGMIWFTLWVLLPMVPAILIYRLFPSTAVAVSGPLANLTVRAGGAFAAYLIVFAAAYPVVQTTKDTKETMGHFQRQAWQLSGQVKLVDTDGKEMTAQNRLNDMLVTIWPALHAVDPLSYTFRLKIVEENEGDFPQITVQIPNFGTKVIKLNPSAGLSVDSYRKTIELKEPIIIRKEAIIIQADTQMDVSPAGSYDPQVDDGLRGINRSRR